MLPGCTAVVEQNLLALIATGSGFFMALMLSRVCRAGLENNSLLRP